MYEAQNPDTDNALGIKQTDKQDDEPKLEKEKAFIKLKRQRRLRKSEMTKIRHHTGEALHHTKGCISRRERY